MSTSYKYVVISFFCCTLLACHESRGRSPSVSGIGEKTDFLTFQLKCKNIYQIKNNADKLINAEVELGSETENLRIQSINGAVPVRCKSVLGVSRHHRRRVHWYGTQRNRRSDVVITWKPRNDNVSPVRQSGQGDYRIPVGWRAQET